MKPIRHQFSEEATFMIGAAIELLAMVLARNEEMAVA